MMLPRTDGALRMAGVRRSPCTTLKNEKTVVSHYRAAGSNPSASWGGEGGGFCAMFGCSPLTLFHQRGSRGGSKPVLAPVHYFSTLYQFIIFPLCMHRASISILVRNWFEATWVGSQTKTRSKKMKQLEPLALAPTLN